VQHRRHIPSRWSANSERPTSCWPKGRTSRRCVSSIWSSRRRTCLRAFRPQFRHGLRRSGELVAEQRLDRDFNGRPRDEFLDASAWTPCSSPVLLAEGRISTRTTGRTAPTLTHPVEFGDLRSSDNSSHSQQVINNQDPLSDSAMLLTLCARLCAGRQASIERASPSGPSKRLLQFPRSRVQRQTSS